MDYAFAQGNEEEFLDVASKLGTAVTFLYTKQEFLKKKKEQLPYPIGLLATSVQDIQLGKRSGHVVAVKKPEQHLVEAGPDLLFDLETIYRKDGMHQRYSGFNHVLATLLAKKKGTLCYSFSSVLNVKGVRRAQLLGRMRQNKEVADKAHLPSQFFSFATAPYELRRTTDLKTLTSLL